MSDKKKKKKKVITMVKVPTTYEGLQCWSPLDSSDDKLLSDKRAIEAEVETEGRSLNANALWAVWYNQISKQGGEYTPAKVKCICKHDYGVPILLAEDKQFRAFYENAFRNFTYEQRVFAMKFCPVTSLFTKDQGSQYQTTLQREYAKQGIQLEIL